MILVRNVFQLKFGKAKDAKALAKVGEEILKRHGHGSTRWLTDLTGSFYTFVMETTYDNLSAFEKSGREVMSTKEFSKWYQKFVPLVKSGRREMFTILD